MAECLFFTKRDPSLSLSGWVLLHDGTSNPVWSRLDTAVHIQACCSNLSCDSPGTYKHEVPDVCGRLPPVGTNSDTTNISPVKPD